MATGTSIVSLVIALVAASVLIGFVVKMWRQWRFFAAPRLVVCPETAHTAAVHVHAVRAALASVADVAPTLTLQDCSRWPDRGRCDQPCLPQVTSGEAPAVPDLMARWYDGKTCVYCGASILDRPHASQAALRGPDGITVEWPDVAPERLPALMLTHQPVCWNCHVAETFRRMYPDRVVDRPAH